MNKKTKAANHLSADEINERIKITKGFWRVKRWLVVLHALTDPAPAKDIAKRVGVGAQTVANLISAYNRFGEQAIETPGKGQRQKAYLSLKEEQAFLAPFFTKATRGEITTVDQIRVELEKRLEGCVAKSTVYRLLKRHGWRKIAPRPSHVNKDVEAQNTFKKTSRHK